MDSGKASGGSGPTPSESLDSDEQDQDESSSFKQNPQHVEDVLANFREKWHQELQESPGPRTPNKLTNQYSKEKDLQYEDYEKDARMLFQRGIDLEKAGKLYEAIQYYRRAVQIVPDIEFRVDNAAKPREAREIIQIPHVEDYESNSEEESSDDEDDDIKEGELLGRIQRKMAKFATLCVAKHEQKTTHISVLPIEIILLILRWLVSVDLDLRSLEIFSQVSRGFYLCGRDPEIWRLACYRVWGMNCGLTPGSYGTWRDMFIYRSRINFHGCYISKTTYIRHGENSFQDQFYRPWHIVAYYRYLRFFPEGLVLMLTSSDEPSQCVGLLRHRIARPPVLTGYYRLKDDKITVVVQRQEKNVPTFNKRNKRKENLHESAEQTFHMELQIKNHHKKKHVQLVWTHYSVSTRTKRAGESTCNFDLVTNRFPPLWFSRVKSFTLDSEAPLQ